MRFRRHGTTGSAYLGMAWSTPYICLASTAKQGRCLAAADSPARPSFVLPILTPAAMFMQRQTVLDGDG